MSEECQTERGTNLTGHDNNMCIVLSRSSGYQLRTWRDPLSAMRCQQTVDDSEAKETKFIPSNIATDAGGGTEFLDNI